MRTTGILLLLSTAFCTAVWLVVTGWMQRRPSLDRSLRHLRRRSIASTSDDARTATRALDRLGNATLSTTVGARCLRWHQPLRLIGRSLPTHVGMLIVAAVVGLAAPAAIVLALQAIGVLPSSVLTPAAVSLAATIALPATVHAEAISRSDDVRLDVRHQLSAYLDMVTMLLAGNTGHEGALDHAARAGDGLLFRELRRRMREVGTTGHSLVRALSMVGADFGVIELEQVAAAATLSASEGAPVARTLAAKCSTLRSTLAAEHEAGARVRTDKVTPPLVGMAVLFMALIIYPALDLT